MGSLLADHLWQCGRLSHCARFFRCFRQWRWRLQYVVTRKRDRQSRRKSDRTHQQLTKPKGKKEIEPILCINRIFCLFTKPIICISRSFAIFWNHHRTFFHQLFMLFDRLSSFLMLHKHPPESDSIIVFRFLYTWSTPDFWEIVCAPCACLKSISVLFHTFIL